MHARVQTWFRFYIHVCINLNPAVAGAGKRQPPLAVTICGKSGYHLDGELQSSWKLLAANAKTESGVAELPDLGSMVNGTELLQPFAQRLNPLHEEILRNYPTQYKKPMPFVNHYSFHSLGSTRFFEFLRIVGQTLCRAKSGVAGPAIVSTPVRVVQRRTPRSVAISPPVRENPE
jgi:hypothetical protein